MHFFISAILSIIYKFEQSIWSNFKFASFFLIQVIAAFLIFSCEFYYIACICAEKVLPLHNFLIRNGRTNVHL